MKYTFGFLGTGNMGGALARAVAKSGAVPVLYDPDTKKVQALAEELHCKAGTRADVAACDFIFVGIKPQLAIDVLQPFSMLLAQRENEDPVIVSMMAGKNTVQVQDYLGADYPIIRIMPNLAVAVGEGVVMYCVSDEVTREQEEIFLASMTHAGLVDRLPEELINAGSAVAGCGPAFTAIFLEALADGGVRCGLSRDKAMQYALCALKGTASLLLQSGQHPAQLKDSVCSPGGSTIAGVEALEAGGFRAATMGATIAAFKRTEQMRV